MTRGKSALLAAVGGLFALWSASASAETIMQALASAYRDNPEINSARALTRADDETVPLALSGYRPVISAFSDFSGSRSDLPLNTAGNRTIGSNSTGFTITQNLFTGFRTRNSVRQAEAGVRASRELLRNTVQNVLFDTASAYLDIIRDQAILDVRRRNVLFLDEQVRASNERFNVGENTRTDVAQARAQLATARAAVSFAASNLAISRATYRRLVGHDPSGLSGGFPYARMVPPSESQAISVGQNDHPLIHATIHQADAQAFVVKQIEGERLPTVSVQGTFEHNESFTNTGTDPNVATVVGRVSIPLFSGGSISARVRQAKELYGRLRIEVDVSRDQVRAAVVTAWAQRIAARESQAAATEGIDAADIALSGVQEEQRVGQRTTLDVLDAQQALLNAREIAIIAQRDQAVASFALLSAMGRLTAESLALPATVYDPREHYDRVRGRVFSSRTPDGR